MITVAVAGGSSPGLGRSILEALKAHPDKLKPIVLGRKSSSTPQWLKDMSIEVKRVDYNSHDSLKEALQGVHTINLLNACLIAGVSRFAPAEFGCGPLAARNISMLAPQIPVIDACRAAKLQYPDFEFAAFHLGIFMNYLGYGSINEEDALHGFNDNWEDSWWHINTMRAEIPLTRKGDIPSVTMTEIRDVGKFVAAACQLSQGKWQENFSMAGETIKMNDVCTIAENVRGQKMQIEYRPYEKTVELKEKEEHFYRKFWYELEEMNARNAVGEGIVEPILNELCPDVKPITVEGYINKYWS